MILTEQSTPVFIHNAYHNEVICVCVCVFVGDQIKGFFFQERTGMKLKVTVFSVLLYTVLLTQ